MYRTWTDENIVPKAELEAELEELQLKLKHAIDTEQPEEKIASCRKQLAAHKMWMEIQEGRRTGNPPAWAESWH